MEVLHDEAGHRFYIQLEGGHEAFLMYRREGNTLDFNHTYVPPDAREKGLAEKIVEAGFRYAKERNLKVTPTCSYVSGGFLKKRPEFLPLVASSP